jgi:hypothetical protein
MKLGTAGVSAIARPRTAPNGNAGIISGAMSRNPRRAARRVSELERGTESIQPWENLKAAGWRSDDPQVGCCLVVIVREPAAVPTVGEPAPEAEKPAQMAALWGHGPEPAVDTAETGRLARSDTSAWPCSLLWLCPLNASSDCRCVEQRTSVGWRQPGAPVRGFGGGPIPSSADNAAADATLRSGTGGQRGNRMEVPATLGVPSCAIIMSGPPFDRCGKCRLGNHIQCPPTMSVNKSRRTEQQRQKRRAEESAGSSSGT